MKKVNESKVIKFLQHNPNPKDMKVHNFAKQHNYEIDKVEEMFYKIATKFVRKQK